MRHRGSEVDVAHALATHARVRDHHAALVTNDTLVLDTLVLAAVTVPVLHGPESAFAEQAVALGLEGAVVDGFGLGHLTVGPRTDRIR